MYRFVLISCFTACCTLFQVRGNAQDQPCHYHIEGTIYDLSTQEALPFATIQIVGTTKGTISDENGYFYLNTICDEEFDLEFSHIGYKKVVHHHDVHHKLPRIYLAPDNVTLQSVIVEGEVQAGDLFTGTVSKLTGKELGRHREENLGDILNRISGVSVIKSGQNVVKPVIHGLHSNRILIINNGVRHEFQNWGAEHAPEIDPSMADNIQVIKGAATVRYGPDALGGVVVINPSRMEFLDPLNGSINGSYSSNGHAGEGNFSIKNGFHKVALLAEGSYLKQGDLHAPDYNLTNTGKEEHSIALGARIHHKNIDISSRYTRFQQEPGILRGSVTESLKDLVEAMGREYPEGTSSFSYEINNPRQVARHDMFRINTEISRKNSVFNVLYAFQKNERQEYDVRRGTDNELPSINLEMVTHSLDADWKHAAWKGWTGTIGAQALYQDNDNIYGTNTIPFIPNFNTSRIGVFIIETKDLSSFTFEWGLRYDYQKSSIRSRQPLHFSNPVFQNVTTTVGIIKNFDSGNYFLSNIGTAWRPPSVSELYAFGKHQNAIEYGLQRYYFDENSNLDATVMLDDKDKPITSEKGLKWINTYHLQKGSWQAELTGYVNFINDFIFTKPAGITTTPRGAFPFFIYDQTNALLSGIDFSIYYLHHKNLESQLQGSYLWARDVSNSDYFVGMPPANLTYSLQYDRKDWLGFSHASVGMEVEYYFRQSQHPGVISAVEILNAKTNGEVLFNENSAAFDFMAPPAGYFLADIHWTGEKKRWTFKAKVSNILNASFRTYTDRMRYFADDVGRNFRLSIGYNF